MMNVIRCRWSEKCLNVCKCDKEMLESGCDDCYMVW